MINKNIGKKFRGSWCTFASMDIAGIIHES
jgi:hypothetical protein